MVKTVIKACPVLHFPPPEDGNAILDIAENFCDTVQGENFSGYPAVFLRLQHCTLNCTWCDTTEVWRKGNPYSIKELLDLWEQQGVIDRLLHRHRLVITGGSPLRQQSSLIQLFKLFESRFGFIPYIEVENEVVLVPDPGLSIFIKHWNNSPKLSNSGMRREVRYKPEVIKIMGSLPNSTFKFVMNELQADWEEIQVDFLDKGLINIESIVLMPEGSNRVALQSRYKDLVELCCEKGVRMCDRLQVTIFDKTVGV